jgi:gluconolactonase
MKRNPLSILLVTGLMTTAQALDGYQKTDTAKFLSPLNVEATLSSPKPFTEGPAVDGRGDVYFTNTGEILKFEAGTRALSVFRKPSTANGQCFDAIGRLIHCEAGTQGDGRVTRTDFRDGSVAVLCDAFGGFPLGAPNDVSTDSQGRIYFTARLSNTDPTRGNVNAVYRIDPDGKTARILAAPDIDMPNGLAVSPDSRTLYLVESDGRENRARCIRAYDLRPDGVVANMRVIIDFSPGRGGDGMRLDEQGNLYIAAGLHKTRGTSETLDTKPGIHVFSPKGVLLAFLETPEDTLTNCAFGGADLRTLYITCGKFLLSTRTTIPGQSRYRVPASGGAGR